MLKMSCEITGEPKCKCERKIGAIREPMVKETLRKLFTDHANYTHLYIINEVENLPTLKFIVDRLMENQTEIGLAFRPYIGLELSKKLENLLKTHISEASNVVKCSIKYGDSCNDEVITLFENSYDVSLFLGSLNPNVLSFENILTHFDQHNKYVIELTKLYINKNYDKIVQKYDSYYTHMLAFSDMLCELTL